ncbi:ribosome small subunit-dependent GTPase A [Halanaerobacter jeridensis]|uniref:Small ribosomal subunit biogenesis GTPase RsgA n=1 Tax=Halanaerobacter jeridensis TaxID=706427 RepID=A0A939BNH8_9FIRM|nr:ribosome small subunit-dependent GTPase A [Halanaerobacter jeridensis]MBM7555517.1 ribosome biogenesis GTPase [Halanaerobacter jeridensis]
MKQGRVVRTYGGYFFVYDFETEEVYRCKIRGRLKQNDIEVIVGDKVEFQELDEGEGIIEDRLERKNRLFRPLISNVDQVVVTTAIREPDLHFKLLDKLLVLAHAADLEVVLCINKVDIPGLKVTKDEVGFYEDIGYQVIYTSATEGEGITELKDALKDKISVFAGPSGAGKSSLLNAIQPDLELQTDNVSDKIKRGKHTTRYVKLLELEHGGWVADTPGFSRLDISFIKPRNLQYFFAEFKEHLDGCKFNSCSHSHEPQCKVKTAVEDGVINEQRYQSYLQLLEELKENAKEDWRR